MARMSNEELQQKKDFAKLLYTTSDNTQKEVARRVGVTEKTIGSWIVEGLWDSLKTSLLTSKADQLRRQYAILAATTDKIESTEGGYGDTKLADMMIKYTAAIRNLEIETSAGAIFETGMRFIRAVQKVNLDDAKMITGYFDAFIQNELNAKF